MTIFTRQEQRFLLFLVCAFFLGLGIKIVRHHFNEKPDKAWAEERQQLLDEFNAKSELLLKEDSTVLATDENSITKSSLTEKININTASAEELQLLPRVGPVLAENIVQFRKTNGPFQTIQDIQKVKRIGPKTFEKLKFYITVD